MSTDRSNSDRPGRYRKLFPRLWRHAGFNALPKSARELALYLLTGPPTNRIGLFHLSVATTAEDLGLTAETVRKGLAGVCQTFAWHFDADARVFYIPSWWRWNTPENANVLIGNLKDLNEIPPCALVDAFLNNIETLDEALHETFLRHSTKHSHRRTTSQEQYLKHFQEVEQDQGAHAPRRTGKDDDLIGLVPQAIEYAGPQATQDEQLEVLLHLGQQKFPSRDYRRGDATAALIHARQDSRGMRAVS